MARRRRISRRRRLVSVGSRRRTSRVRRTLTLPRGGYRL